MTRTTIKVELVVAKVQSPGYVELNDFSGFRVPGKVVLRTVDPVPVNLLPAADLNQYGHVVADGSVRIHPKDAERLLGREPKKGDRIVVETAVAYRNRGMRKGGFFHCMGLRPVRISEAPAGAGLHSEKTTGKEKQDEE